jgi:hypothetical protein
MSAVLDDAWGAVSEREATFFLVRIATTDHIGVATAIEQAAAFSFDARVCLALDQSTLSQVDVRRLEMTTVGLLLDGVNVRTSVAGMIHEAIEAVRFEPAFVSAAAHDIRLGCALRSMLDLATNLGLATLGPVMASDEATLAVGRRFDWATASMSTARAQLPVGSGAPSLA